MASNPLADLIPAQYRKYVYLVAAAALFVYSVYQATEGDLEQFAVALLTALVPALAASNTPVTVPEAVDEVQDVAEETGVEVVPGEVVEDPSHYDGHGGVV